MRAAVGLILLTSAVAFAASGTVATGGGPTAAVPGELIVGFQPGVPRAEQGRALGQVSATVRRSFGPIQAALVRVPQADTERALARLRRDPRVRYAEPNFVVRADSAGVLPDDPAFDQLWGLDNSGQVVNFIPGTPDADIDAREAWGVTTGSPNVVVAVVDTGIDYGHPDLAANQWINPGENCAGCRSNGVDDDGNGYVDDWHGWDFANGDNDPLDDNGHGTHVAGTIGAVGNNGTGVTGVNWTTRLMALKFIGANGSGSVADAVSAILYASANGARVLNNSWGGDEFSQALLDAIRVADGSGSLFVAAAGNSFTDTDTAPNYPSSYDVPNLISVAATDNLDLRAWFSNYGRRSVDLGAPGVSIYSTWPGNSYRYLDGTSMAAPHVAGAAALAEAAFPTATAVGIKALLLRTVDPLAALSGSTATGGRLNVNNAVRCSVDPELWLEAPRGTINAYVGDSIPLTVLAAHCGDPAGVAVSATANGSPIDLTPRGDGLFTASYAASTAGSISIQVTATAGGSTDVQTVSGLVSPTYTIAPGGPAVTVTTTVPGQNARLSFAGSAGQQVSLKLSAGTMTLVKVSILNPDGTTLTSTTVGSSGFLEPKTLPASGAYAILVDPNSSNTGSLTLTLYDVPPEVTGSIAPGGPAVTVTTTVPGQNARLSFAGSAGQQVSLKLSAGTMTLVKVSILNPDGTTLTSTTVGSSGFLEPKTLPASGAYAILVDPNSSNTGSLTLTLYDVPPEVTGSIAPGGPAVTVTTTVPGQNARLSFAGSAGQQVSLNVSAVTMTLLKVSILKPDGTTLASSTFGNGGGTISATLPTTGTYTIVVDPQSSYTGSATLRLT